MTGRAPSPTIEDVAREAGVSISTVSRFLNGSTLVADETVDRVREAIRKLGYLPRTAARNLALRRTNTLGVLIEAIGTPFFADVVDGAEQAAYEEGYSLLIATINHMQDGHLPALGPFNTDGLLLVNVQLDEKNYGFIQEGYPIVSLYEPAPRSMNIPFLSVQNKRGTFQAIEHLIKEHGFTKIGFLRGPKGNNDSYWRELGYRQAHKHYGIPVDERWIGEGGFVYPGARKTLIEWSKSGQMPQAIFTGDDDTALDVLLTLYRLGIRVPEDVAVVGFDDSSMAPTMVPPLTTVHAPIKGIGQEGVKKLLMMIRTGETEPITLLPTKLVIRRSCGCPYPAEKEVWPQNLPEIRVNLAGANAVLPVTSAAQNPVDTTYQTAVSSEERR